MNVERLVRVLRATVALGGAIAIADGGRRPRHPKRPPKQPREPKEPPAPPQE